MENPGFIIIFFATLLSKLGDGNSHDLVVFEPGAAADQCLVGAK
jgi:hypothetical protein